MSTTLETSPAAAASSIAPLRKRKRIAIRPSTTITITHVDEPTSQKNTNSSPTRSTTASTSETLGPENPVPRLTEQQSLLQFSIQALAARYAEHEQYAAVEIGRLLERLNELHLRCDILEQENQNLKQSQAEGCNTPQADKEITSPNHQDDCDAGGPLEPQSGPEKELQKSSRGHLLNERAFASPSLILQDGHVTFTAAPCHVPLITPIAKVGEQIADTDALSSTLQRFADRPLQSRNNTLASAYKARLSSQDRVSHDFVEEIMQDNHDLHETLTHLQEEVKTLRKQLLTVREPDSHITSQDAPRRLSLADASFRRYSIAHDEGAQNQDLPAVHVHHHYHRAPTKANLSLVRRSKSQSHVKAKKPQYSSNAQTFHGVSVTRQTMQRPPLETILSNDTLADMTPTTPVTALRVPSSNVPLKFNFPNSKRCSSSNSNRTVPSLTLSSNPSTPQSSVFETTEASDISRPTSRGSSVIWRPYSGSSPLAGNSILPNLDHSSTGFKPLKLPWARQVSGASPKSLDLPRTRARNISICAREESHDFGKAGTLDSQRQSPTTTKPGIAIRQPLSSISTNLPIGPAFLTATAPTATPSLCSPPTISPMLSRVSVKGSSTIVTRPTITAKKPIIARAPAAQKVDSLASKSAPKASASSRPQQEAYTPLVDTLGKRVGGWLSSKIGGNGNTATSSAQPTQHHASRATSNSSLISTTANLGMHTHNKENETSTEGQGGVSATKPRLSSERRRRRKLQLMAHAGIDPVSGLPAMRQVSGAKDPRMSGGIDQDALKECLEGVGA